MEVVFSSATISDKQRPAGKGSKTWRIIYAANILAIGISIAYMVFRAHHTRTSGLSAPMVEMPLFIKQAQGLTESPYAALYRSEVLIGDGKIDAAIPILSSIARDPQDRAHRARQHSYLG